MSLLVTSCQSENADQGCAEIIAWVTDSAGLDLDFIDAVDWQTRRSRVDSGEIEIAWMCGLWYVKRRDDLGQFLDPLIAPVMQAERYLDQPAYDSKLLVRSDTQFDTLQSLAGARFAINEPDSHSGCVIVGYALAQAGLTWQHFDSVIVSGGHLDSLEMLLAGTIDAAAIDGTVLDTELRVRPELRQLLRPIATLGPSPIPPWTVHQSVSAETREKLLTALAQMHRDPAGCAILTKHGYKRFEPITDDDYDAIRLMRSRAYDAGDPLFASLV